MDLARFRSMVAGILPASLLFSALIAADDSPALRKDALLVPLPARTPAPPDNPTTSEKVALGKQLFFDPRLSGDNTMSCATCHLPKKAYGDGLAPIPLK